jgi:hypothetical protein
VIESKTDKGRLKHILSDGLSFFKNLPHRKMPAFLLRQFGLFQSISSQLADSLIASVAWPMPTKKIKYLLSGSLFVLYGYSRA